MNFIPSVNLFKNSSVVNFCRYYAFKSDLKIKWIRPEKIPCISPEKSGDQSALPPLEGKNYRLGFENSKELQNADEYVKSLFHLENIPRKYKTEIYVNNFVRELQRHEQDWGSMEARLARMTASIRRLQESAIEHPRNKKMKVILKEKIDKRKKFLKYLRRWDYKRFEWVLDKLDLIYKPPPNEFHMVTRKESLRKLTNIHCENIKNQRLTEYRKILEDQQISFLEKKLKNLEFIRNEQKECEIPITVTQEDIDNVKKRLINLQKTREEQQLKSANENKL